MTREEINVLHDIVDIYEKEYDIDFDGSVSSVYCS